MRRISAGRGMTFGLKCLLRGVERDNEEAIIGTQLRFGEKRLPRASAGRTWRTLIAPLQFGSGNRGNIFDATIVNVV
jgi:hypothetical protein